MITESYHDELKCSAEDYWHLTLDPDFQRELRLDILKYRGFEVRENTDLEREIRRTYFCDPRPSSVPPAFSRLLPDSSWEERGVFDRENGQYNLSYVTSSMPGRVRLTARISCEPQNGAIVRFVTSSIEVKLGPLSSWLERSILGDVAKTFREAAALAQKKASCNLDRETSPGRDPEEQRKEVKS